MSTIDMLKERCSELLIKECNNKTKVAILSTISEILKQPKAMVKLDAEVVLNILKDLGFSKKEIPEIYASILKEN